jgi:hypothetical protein
MLENILMGLVIELVHIKGFKKILLKALASVRHRPIDGETTLKMLAVKSLNLIPERLHLANAANGETSRKKHSMNAGTTTNDAALKCSEICIVLAWLALFKIIN